MGILNLTDDSFSADGLARDPVRALDVVREMEDAGADLIDIGAESTRPGAAPVSVAEELARLRPVLRAVGCRSRVPLSIDTTKAPVANFALDEGVSIVNDVSALDYDPGLGPLRRGARRPGGADAHARPSRRHVRRARSTTTWSGEVGRELQRRVERAVGYGIGWDGILLDPGIGFAKRAEHSLARAGRRRGGWPASAARCWSGRRASRS